MMKGDKMQKELTTDEMYLLRMYAAETVEDLLEMLETARKFASDSITTDAVSALMMKAAYLTDEELKALQN